MVTSTIYRNAALGNGVAVHFADKRVNLDPNKREDRGQKHGPKNNNGGSSVLATHETLEEWVEMKNHPKGEENFAKQWTPSFVSFV